MSSLLRIHVYVNVTLNERNLLNCNKTDDTIVYVEYRI